MIYLLIATFLKELLKYIKYPLSILFFILKARRTLLGRSGLPYRIKKG
jgi:hypothetical protein